MEAVHVSLIQMFIRERMLLIREMAVKTHSLISYYTSITKNRRGIIQAMNNKNWSLNVLRSFFFSHWYFSPFFLNSGCCPSSSSMCLLNSWSVLASPHRSYITYNLWKHHTVYYSGHVWSCYNETCQSIIMQPKAYNLLGLNKKIEEELVGACSYYYLFIYRWQKCFA